jgi:hypothetical protein
MHSTTEKTMNTIRIRVANLNRAMTVATGLGLVIDSICGDSDKEYLNIGARQAGVRGNHEPKWTDEQKAAFNNWKL